MKTKPVYDFNVQLPDGQYTGQDVFSKFTAAGFTLKSLQQHYTGDSEKIVHVADVFDLVLAMANDREVIKEHYTAVSTLLSMSGRVQSEHDGLFTHLIVNFNTLTTIDIWQTLDMLGFELTDKLGGSFLAPSECEFKSICQEVVNHRNIYAANWPNGIEHPLSMLEEIRGVLFNTRLSKRLPEYKHFELYFKGVLGFYVNSPEVKYGESKNTGIQMYV